ncbi:GLPGLI family protein [Aestuariibaculum sediminum]|uniref:GLPGLI family protein n=1 Tax=Aestuariibaculum sediminum TaxID=2770637 RepID=A0A8J6Q412_9FLAO|nr:GLPGLI family protein [Aestuariibaculum sediminum]MBD0832960.1 GLPGLI family protein [Aestuariibaculum sediminum]
MKKNHLKIIFLGLALVFMQKSMAQKDFQAIAYYSSSTSIDPTRFGDGNMDPERQKRIVERMKNMLDKSYTLMFNQTESMYRQVENESSEGNRWRGMMNSFNNGPKYKNTKENLLVQDQEFFGKQFLIKDELPKLEWKMTNESKKIGDYICLKATAKRMMPNIGFESFRRNSEGEEPKEMKEVEVEAWYTLQLPVNMGPGDYWGLPGLILEITEENKTLYCNKIVMNPPEGIDLEKPSKGKEITREEFDALKIKKTEEMRAQFRERRGDRRF